MAPHNQPLQPNTHRYTSQLQILKHTSSKHTQTHKMGWWESSQCGLINSGGRLKPLTQWAAMSCLWFLDKPHMPERSIPDLNRQLLNHLPATDTHTRLPFWHMVINTLTAAHTDLYICTQIYRNPDDPQQHSLHKQLLS